MANQGCKNGKYFYGGVTGWKSWANCFLPGGHDFYAFMRCREGYTHPSLEYPTTGKYTAWTRGGCPTNPREYGQHIVN